MQDMVEITDGVLDNLASRADVTRALPFLFEALIRAKKEVSRCSRCRQEGARKNLQVQYDRTRLAIVALSPADRAQLRGFLDARQLRLQAGRNHQGSAVVHTLT